MSWAKIFALLKRFYNFSHDELIHLTLNQISLYMAEIQETMFMLGEATREEQKSPLKEEIINIAKQEGRKIPRNVKK